MHQIHTHVCACTYTCHSYRHTFTYTCTRHGPASAHTHTNYFIHKPTHSTQLSAQVPRKGHFFVRTVRAMLQVPAILHRSPLKRSAQVTLCLKSGKPWHRWCWGCGHCRWLLHCGWVQPGCLSRIFLLSLLHPSPPPALHPLHCLLLHWLSSSWTSISNGHAHNTNRCTRTGLRGSGSR